MLEKRKGLPVHVAVIWDELADSVQEEIGCGGLEALCGQVHRMRQAELRITAEGMVVQDVKGNPAEVRSWIAKFGIRNALL